MKSQQALEDLKHYLKGAYHRYSEEDAGFAIDDLEEEINTLQTVVDALPELLLRLKEAQDGWKEFDYESPELQASIKFLDELKKQLEM